MRIIDWLQSGVFHPSLYVSSNMNTIIKTNQASVEGCYHKLSESDCSFPCWEIWEICGFTRVLLQFTRMIWPWPDVSCLLVEMVKQSWRRRTTSTEWQRWTTTLCHPLLPAAVLVVGITAAVIRVNSYTLAFQRVMTTHPSHSIVTILASTK